MTALHYPVFMSSIMKSGTWLLRAILEMLTGLQYYEPEHRPGQHPRYEDEALIEFPPNCFFSWHSLISEGGIIRLKDFHSKNIFLVRNVYDLVASMYNHLATDADAAIGRSVGDSSSLLRHGPEAAISMIISGFMNTEMAWKGLAPHLRQAESFIHFIESEGDALLISYEQLTLQKEDAVRRVADYLGIDMNEDEIQNIILRTSFQAMEEAAQQNGTAKHFGGAKSADIKRYFRPYHVAMVDHLISEHIPDATARLKRVGVSDFTSTERLHLAPGGTSAVSISAATQSPAVTRLAEAPAPGVHG